MANRVKKMREGARIPTPGGDIYNIEEPLWLDKQKFRRAREIYKEHFASINFSHLCGLLLSFYFEKNVKTLQSTGMHDTTKRLLQRYVDTVRHIQSWYEGDVWDINNKARKSLFTVRSMHTRAASKMSKQEGDNVVYVSQWDMVLTQWAFMGPLLLFPTKVGFHGATDEDLDAIAHFWRGIGYLLGTEDRYNLGHGTLHEVTNACYQILHDDYREKVRVAHPSSVSMGESVTGAFSIMSPLFTWGCLSNYVHELVDVPCPFKMGFFDWLCYKVFNFMTCVALKFKFPRFFFNEITRWQVDMAEGKLKPAGKSYVQTANALHTRLTAG